MAQTRSQAKRQRREPSQAPSVERGSPQAPSVERGSPQAPSVEREEPGPLRLSLMRGPMEPEHLASMPYGFVVTGPSPLISLVVVPGECRIMMQQLLSHVMQVDFDAVIAALLLGELPREVSVHFVESEYDSPPNPIVIWYAISHARTLFPLNVTNWILPGGVRVAECAAVRAAERSRLQAFDALKNAIEDTSSELNSATYKALYDAAMCLHRADWGSSAA